MFQYFLLFVYLLTYQLDCYISKPLFLTPLIENGKIKSAQKQAEVKPFLQNIRSYSGYLTVNKEYNSNIFFWFFPKTSNWTDAPLVLWLQGGPGVTSILGIFCENGPYVFEKGKLRQRRHSWTNFYNLLYVDVPVGAGFSFSDSSKGYGGNRTVVGGHLFEVLRQFLLLFPQMQKNKLILSSESYAGKHLSSLAYTILTTKSTKPKIEIWKIFMCSPWLSPEDMLPHYSSYMVAHGLLDGHGRDIMRQQEELILFHIRDREWMKALQITGQIFESANNDSLIYKLAGLSNKLNLVRDNQPSRLRPYFHEFIDKNETKAVLHVRNEKFIVHNKSITYKQIDFMESIRGEFGIVLENFRTLTYFGQFDILTPCSLHTKVMENTDWSGNWEYTRAHRQPFWWKKHLCGYYKTAKSYTEVMVRNAGHLVPGDQPRCTLALLQAFINGDFD